ncbi:PREDICTED: LRR receptor-like serine/threonine-protein kinase GSO2 [Prunus mume]|uniref:LRR receptor-like serine/threonine-protein kinase GSO2 n=1 Tax=Prunus mume TaxID=102107 RepID=A0ABM1LLC4_PRUMU|nr:PREDICTED: LRR receptor-like serine/threonine-protein kinase GSO2 [Prunus mume]
MQSGMRWSTLLWGEIWVIDVAYNNLSGKLPNSIGVPGSLFMLKVNNNNLDGEIRLSLQNCTSLRHIDLGNNRFTGTIPSWIGSNVPLVSILRLRSNFFTGYIPQQLCNLGYLHILDLAHNNFSGTIPKCLNHLSALTHGNSSAYDLYSYYDQQTSVVKVTELEYQRQTLMLVKSIDLSSNSLEGEIPEEICSLLLLHSLNLSENQLSGNIPSNIGSLQLLEVLDLSRNRLSGWIPQSLSSSTFLSHLNFSYNNLTGAVIRDKTGIFARGTGKARLACSPIEAEAHAALNGLEVASDLGSIHLECESDSKELVQSIKGNIQSGGWTIYPILAAIKEKCRWFDSCSWKWIPRRANKAADAAALVAKRRMCDEVWLNRPPSSLVFVLQIDGLPCPPQD